MISTLRKPLGIVVAVMMIALVLMALGGCASDSSDTASQDDTSATSDSGDLIPATIGYWGGGVCEMPIYVAYEYGYFQKYGIDPTLYVITDDLSVVVASGAIDAVETQPGDLVAILEGAPITWVDTLHTGCYALACRPDDGIETVADLEGKTVAVDGFTGSGYITLYNEILEEGGNPDLVNFVIYSSSAMEIALENGEVDAFLAHDPYAQIAARNGQKLLWEQATGIVGDYCCCFLGIVNDTLEANPELAVRLSMAFEEAVQYAQDNVEEVTEMAIEKGYLVGDVEIQLQNTETYTFSGGDEAWFDESIRAYWDMEYECGNLPDAPDPETDEEGYEAYIAELTAKMSRYMGSGSDAALEYGISIEDTN